MELSKYYSERRPDVEYFIENTGDDLGNAMKILMRRLYRSEISIDEFDERVKSRVGSALTVLGSIDD